MSLYGTFKHELKLKFWLAFFWFGGFVIGFLAGNWSALSHCGGGQ